MSVPQMDDIWSHVNLARTSSWSATGRGESSRDEHRGLYDAIRRRDAAVARLFAEADVSSLADTGAVS